MRFWMKDFDSIPKIEDFIYLEFWMRNFDVNP
jgi:hypothetical protein